MCCTPEEARKYKRDMLGIVKTHIAPSYTVHPRTGDVYAAYNKPEAVLDWLQHVTPAEDWVVVLDSDMLLRRPFLPSDFNLTRGWAISARYDYMVGVNNELADRHIPEIAPRNDTLAGPAGRRSDRVGQHGPPQGGVVHGSRGARCEGSGCLRLRGWRSPQQLRIAHCSREQCRHGPLPLCHTTRSRLKCSSTVCAEGLC